jgi:hypothetical protein
MTKLRMPVGMGGGNGTGIFTAGRQLAAEICPECG